jgi:hypothetical protein
MTDECPTHVDPRFPKLWQKSFSGALFILAIGVVLGVKFPSATSFAWKLWMD